jgi:hypothetical protein
MITTSSSPQFQQTLQALRDAYHRYLAEQHDIKRLSAAHTDYVFAWNRAYDVCERYGKIECLNETLCEVERELGLEGLREGTTKLG